MSLSPCLFHFIVKSFMSHESYAHGDSGGGSDDSIVLDCIVYFGLSKLFFKCSRHTRQNAKHWTQSLRLDISSLFSVHPSASHSVLLIYSILLSFSFALALKCTRQLYVFISCFIPTRDYLSVVKRFAWIAQVAFFLLQVCVAHKYCIQDHRNAINNTMLLLHSSQTLQFLFIL